MVGLSCYTENLHNYVDREWDADSIFTASIRLAVAESDDGIIRFSHHQPSLDRLPDGSRLEYTVLETIDTALHQLESELQFFGRALVVVERTALPWSGRFIVDTGPQWVVIDGHRRGSWHVVDGFDPGPVVGARPPHSEWLHIGELRRAITLDHCWLPGQNVRNMMAFGNPVELPTDGIATILRRIENSPMAPELPNLRWHAGTSCALQFLLDRLASGIDVGERHFDDLWAAASHHVFAYRNRIRGESNRQRRHHLACGLAAWSDLPRWLRLATESAKRGRPRDTLIGTALESVVTAERCISL